MLPLDEILDKLALARDNVANACARSGRNPSDVVLSLATKTQPAELLVRLHERENSLIFGENRVQEMLEKWTPEFRWQFIGQLQTNKVKYIIDKVELIHSLDRVELASEIDKRARSKGFSADCLVEINMGSELSKGGVEPQDASDFLNELTQFGNIRVRGLMSVLPNVPEKELRPYYEKLQRLYSDLSAINGFDVLSAGMSHDYEIAVEYGANLLRLGSAVFGPRA